MGEDGTPRTGAGVAALFDGPGPPAPDPVSRSRRRAGPGSSAVVPRYGAVAVKP